MIMLEPIWNLIILISNKIILQFSHWDGWFLFPEICLQLNLHIFNWIHPWKSFESVLLFCSVWTGMFLFLFLIFLGLADVEVLLFFELVRLCGLIWHYRIRDGPSCMLCNQIFNKRGRCFCSACLCTSLQLHFHLGIEDGVFQCRIVSAMLSLRALAVCFGWLLFQSILFWGLFSRYPSPCLYLLF